jgi:hypothetical protein
MKRMLRSVGLSLILFGMLIIGILSMLPKPGPTSIELMNQAYDLDKRRQDDQATVSSRTTAIDIWNLLPPVLLTLVVVGMLAPITINTIADARERRARYAPDENGFYELPKIDRRQLADNRVAQLTIMHYAGQNQATIARHTAPPIVMRGEKAPAALPMLTASETPAQLPGITDLTSLLSSWRPSLESILLAIGADGKPIMVPARDIWHVALAGPTGGGKSNIVRLMVAQILACGGRVVLGDPKYTPFDAESGEDWRPIAQRLHLAPAVTTSAIGDLLTWSIEELDRRLELRREGQKVGAPLFIALDELPAIVADVKDAPDQLARIIRMGRAVGLLTICSAQDFLIKTIGGSSGARENFRSAFYMGGDLRTGAALLDMRQTEIDESQLSQGVALLRSKATPQATIVRVPLASNEAIYQLLEPETLTRSGFQSPAETAHRETVWKDLGTPLETKIDVISTPSEWAKTAMTPEEARVISMFTHGEDIPTIIKDIYQVTTGRRYQEASTTVQAIIRGALEKAT